MASRFYFPLTEAAPVTPPAPGAEWEHVNGVTRKLLTSPDTSALTTTAYTADGADDLTNKDACHHSYVSDGLAAQLISGNVKAQVQVVEASTTNNLSLTIKIDVIRADGSVVRQTILAITRDGTEANNSIRNLGFNSVALTNYTCVAGDRLNVEIGLGGTPSAGAGTDAHNGSIRWGCSAAGGDLPENDTDTGTTLRGWIEFSNTIALNPAPHAMHYARLRR